MKTCYAVLPAGLSREQALATLSKDFDGVEDLFEDYSDRSFDQACRDTGWGDGSSKDFHVLPPAPIAGRCAVWCFGFTRYHGLYVGCPGLREEK